MKSLHPTGPSTYISVWYSFPSSIQRRNFNSIQKISVTFYHKFTKLSIILSKTMERKKIFQEPHFKTHFKTVKIKKPSIIFLFSINFFFFCIFYLFCIKCKLFCCYVSPSCGRQANSISTSNSKLKN